MWTRADWSIKTSVYEPYHSDQSCNTGVRSGMSLTRSTAVEVADEEMERQPSDQPVVTDVQALLASLQQQQTERDARQVERDVRQAQQLAERDIERDARQAQQLTERDARQAKQLEAYLDGMREVFTGKVDELRQELCDKTSGLTRKVNR